MSRNIKIIILLILFVLLAKPLDKLFAQVETKEKISSYPTEKPVKNPTPSTIIDNEAKDLQDKIASKVAELTKESKKVVSGYIAKKGDEAIELISNNDKNYKVLIDKSITTYYSLEKGEKKEIGLSDLKKDDYIIAFGPLIEDSVNANYILKEQEYFISVGKIINVEKEDYLIKIMSSDKDEYSLDIEKTTKQQMLNLKTLEINKIGFSKIKEGDTIHFVIRKNYNQKPGRFPALRILIIPQEYFISG